MHIKTSLTVLFLTALISSCSKTPTETAATNAENKLEKYSKGTFEYDLNFLKEKDEVVVLKAGQAQVIVSPKYQGKVFTSTADGDKGKSFGWINYDVFDKPKSVHMNAYGGENRFWLGPEGNKFSIFFKPFTKMDFENWITPSGFDSEPWTLKSNTDQAAELTKRIRLLNYSGAQFTVDVRRNIQILNLAQMSTVLGTAIDSTLKAVGYTTLNEITNSGEEAWVKETGAPCIWILDMFNPSDSTTIIIPYKTAAKGKVVTTDYFGEIPKERISIKENVILFKADGKSRGKIGVSPNRARDIAGSYDSQNNILTVVKFDLDEKGTYLNQEWNTKKDPLLGDAVNAYNDGPLDGDKQMGPFYELESVSPAAFLAVGEKLTHNHHVFHFTGDRQTLVALMKKLFGVSEETVSKL